MKIPLLGGVGVGCGENSISAFTHPYPSQEGKH